MKAPTRNPLLSALRKIRNPEERVPPGYKTVMEWGRAWGLGRTQAFRLLRDGVAGGIVAVRPFRRRIGDGRSQIIPHYRQKTKR